MMMMDGRIRSGVLRSRSRSPRAPGADRRTAAFFVRTFSCPVFSLTRLWEMRGDARGAFWGGMPKKDWSRLCCYVWGGHNAIPMLRSPFPYLGPLMCVWGAKGGVC
ncbi:unnamed protein product [Periconia digitata]|uniref:Uncharacterized protein n=1 Tax=Periconia digitata TaxID=1303443 RepID=A0A9W4XUH1_9PLEO|nr:unnamed protein product [Periconia digitata]